MSILMLNVKSKKKNTLDININSTLKFKYTF